jgi:hypothetical protein
MIKWGYTLKGFATISFHIEVVETKGFNLIYEGNITFVMKTYMMKP